VAGFEEKYEPAPGLKPVRGNSAERMLESCTTVDDAIAFYRTHREADFFRSRVLIADRSGASVVIGARNGQLHIVKRTDSRGFGYGHATLVQELPKSPAPTVENGAAILRACLQPGDGGTKYSNVFDLNSGDIFLYPSLQHDPVPLNLAAELAKGAHYYDIPRLREQLAQAPRPLLDNMRRFFLDEFQPLPDQQPILTARIQKLLEDAATGKLQSADYTPEFWAKIASRQKDFQSDLQKLGALRSVTLVGREESAGKHHYRYLAEFTRARVLSRFVVDAQNKFALIQREFHEPRPDLGEAK
jgi:hypothetical protein